jgi:hypothetical protein
MIKTTVMLSEELHQKIKEYGFKNKLSLGEVVRQGVESFLGPISQESQNTDKPMVTDAETSVKPEWKDEAFKKQVVAANSMDKALEEVYGPPLETKEQMKKENTKLNKHLNKIKTAANFLNNLPANEESIKNAYKRGDLDLMIPLIKSKKEKSFVRKRGEMSVEDYV